MLQKQIANLTEKLYEGTDAKEFWLSSAQVLNDLGVSGIGYGVIPYATDAEINGFSSAGSFKHTYPDEWVSAIEGEAQVDNDPSVDMIVEGCPELIWSDFDKVELTCKHQRLQNELDNDIGMLFGASLSLDRNVFGQVISGIGLWVSDVNSEAEFTKYWSAHREQIRQVCHILDEGLRGHHAGLLVSLSPREKDCLTYLAIGLRPAEICWRLKISEKTFEKYIKGAKDKLKARTRDHAIAKALVLNLIQP